MGSHWSSTPSAIRSWSWTRISASSLSGAHSTVLLAFEDVTHRRAIEREVEELLREKEMLLQEMQHRVANASILLMKAKTVQSEEARLQLENAHQRVLPIAVVQQHLHMEGGGEPIDIGAHLEKLGKTLAQSMIGDSRPISLKVIADPGSVMAREAASVGLVVTELVTNALKHAFPEPKADAAILVRYDVAATDWQLTISDNGVGRLDVSASTSKPGLSTQPYHGADQATRCRPRHRYGPARRVPCR